MHNEELEREMINNLLVAAAWASVIMVFFGSISYMASKVAE